MDQGKTQMAVRFDKNVFFSNEVANADVTVDNHQCKLRITSVDFEVEQKIRINGRHQWSGKFDVIKTSDIQGINASYTEPVTNRMSLNLGSIIFVVNNMKSVKKPGIFSGRELVPRSPEEIF